MSIRSKTTMMAAMAAMALLALTGCAPATSGANPTETQAPSASADPTSGASTAPETRQITVVKVIDVATFVVTPYSEDDEFYGEELTMHVEGIAGPAEGECGFAETIDVVTTRFPANVGTSIKYDEELDGGWIDDKGEHHGDLVGNSGTSYAMAILDAGFAYPTVENERYDTTLPHMQKTGVGLHGLCPGFGE